MFFRNVAKLLPYCTRHVPENSNLYSHRYKNFKSQTPHFQNIIFGWQRQSLLAQSLSQLNSLLVIHLFRQLCG
jgi:hypothetical protein